MAVSTRVFNRAGGGATYGQIVEASWGAFNMSAEPTVFTGIRNQGTAEPGFRTNLHYKDLNIALSTGAEYGVPLPGTALVQEFFKAMRAAGRGDYDHSGIITILEDLAKVEVKSG